MCTKQHISIYLCVVRVRLRKKTWKNPGTVFLDYHVYEEDISISSNWEVFLEVLDGNLCFSLSFKHCFTMRFSLRTSTTLPILVLFCSNNINFFFKGIVNNYL